MQVDASPCQLRAHAPCHGQDASKGEQKTPQTRVVEAQQEAEPQGGHKLEGPSEGEGEGGALLQNPNPAPVYAECAHTSEEKNGRRLDRILVPVDNTTTRQAASDHES
jgi:hypothetical protein